MPVPIAGIAEFTRAWSKTKLATGTTKRERSCVGCGLKSSKADLHRIVRASDGSIRFDERGNIPGRGAYVCSKSCFDKAYRGGKLQRALRAPLSQEDAERAGLQIEAACAAGEH